MDKIYYFQWHITNLCNFRCQHCYQNEFDASSELDSRNLKCVAEQIIQAAKNNSTQVVLTITGGEPFLREDLFELLTYLDLQDEIKKIILISNGSMINQQIVERIKLIKKLREIKISLEGASAEVNDKIRGEGSFDRAMKGIRLLKKETDLSIMLMFTAMKSNLEEVEDLFKLCYKERLDGLVIERFFPLGVGREIREELLDSADWQSFIKAVFFLVGEPYTEKAIVAHRAFWIKLIDGKAEFWGAKCNISRNNLCIMPDATVYPCRRFPLKLGNLLKAPLDDITESTVLWNVMNGKKKGKCGTCDIEGCRGCPALAFVLDKDYLAQDSQCWHKRRD